MNIILTNPVILMLSVIALIMTVSARFITNKHIGNGLSVISFVLVLASITYALLLGAELTAVLIYLLVFALLGIISFLPSDVSDFSEVKSKNENLPDETESLSDTADKSSVYDNIENKGEEGKK